MGSPQSETGRLPDEDQVRFTLTQGFWMLSTEVTQELYEKVMKTNPSHFKGAKHPVEQISWSDATEFATKLQRGLNTTGVLPSSWEIRLPTEAQWEYACRAGSTTAYSFGDSSSELERYAWYLSRSKYLSNSNTTHEAATKLSNRWGLYDMHKNVEEWVRDWYQSCLPGESDPEVTRAAPATYRFRVVRGGHWLSGDSLCRSAFRTSYKPTFRNGDQGFRVALVPFP